MRKFIIFYQSTAADSRQTRKHRCVITAATCCRCEHHFTLHDDAMQAMHCLKLSIPEVQLNYIRCSYRYKHFVLE